MCGAVVVCTRVGIPSCRLMSDVFRCQTTFFVDMERVKEKTRTIIVEEQGRDALIKLLL